MPEPLTVHMPQDARRTRGLTLRFLAGLGFLAVVAIAGYVIFPAFAASPSLSTYGFLLVAAVAGAAAFFSPCSFPLLPSYFAYTQVAYRGRSHDRSRAVADGLASGAGVNSFNVLLGGVLGTAGLGIAQSLLLLVPNPSGVTLALRSVVGIALVALGAVQVANVSLHGRLLNRILQRIQPRDRPCEPRFGLFVYGFAYTLTGIGCTAPFLATVLVVSLAAGGLLQAFAGFLVFALSMFVFMVGVSVMAVGSGRRFLRGLSERTPVIKRAGGIALQAFGVLLLVLTAWPRLLRPLFP